MMQLLLSVLREHRSIVILCALLAAQSVYSMVQTGSFLESSARSIELLDVSTDQTSRAIAVAQEAITKLRECRGY